MPGRTLPMAAATLMGLVSLGVIATSCSNAASQPRSEAEIEEIVRAYLLDNPEIIFEAAEIYQQRQMDLARAGAEEAARTYLPQLRREPAGHVVEAATGEPDVVVVEFFDYNCGFCRQATDFVFDLQADNPAMELIFQELPVTNPASRNPALAALAVAGTDGYVDFHREMMNATGLVDGPRAASIANDLDLPSSLIDAALSETAAQEALHERLDQSIDIATEIGIDGTPAFLIASPDGEYVRVVHGFNEAGVTQAIEEVRNAAAR